MSTITNFFRNALTKFCQQGVTDRANFLKNIGLIGWILSSLAQTTALIFNDKIPAKEKRFLVPQEIFDGLTNATLFWFITSKATDLGKSLVLKKIVMPKSISKIMESFTPNTKNIVKLKDAFLAHAQSLGGKRAVKKANTAIEGMGVLTGITGAVLANNIVTPLVRNKLAGICQKKEMQKYNDNAPLNPYYGSNINPQTFQSFRANSGFKI